MAMRWFCDITGKEVFLAPKATPKMKDGKPVTKFAKNFNGNTNKVDTLEVYDVEYESEKAYLVRLSVGDENIQLCVCKEALDKIMPQASKLWNVMEGYIK